jgi:hypothetical protein
MLGPLVRRYGDTKERYGRLPPTTKGDSLTTKGDEFSET